MAKPLTEEEQIRAKAQRTRVKSLASHLRAAGIELRIVAHRLGSLIQIDQMLPNKSLAAFEKAIEAFNGLVLEFYGSNPGQKITVLWSVTRSVYSIGTLPAILIREAIGGSVIGYALSEDRKQVFVATDTGVLVLGVDRVTALNLML
jgi:hypothetical protein